MPTFELNKLVRTGLPAIYEELGEAPAIEMVTGETLLEQLLDKLREEVLEYENDERTSVGLADIEQVCQDIEVALSVGQSFPDEVTTARYYIAAQQLRLDIDEAMVEEARQKKLEYKGGFVEQDDKGNYIGIRVTSLVLNDGDHWVEYYRKDRVRFPEVQR